MVTLHKWNLACGYAKDIIIHPNITVCFGKEVYASGGTL
jgi:hypothetical protein